jgi:predicted transcriptional regulator
MEMQLTIRIPDEYSLRIEKLTKKMGLKKSDVARLALKQFLDENSIEEKDKPFDKIKHLLGVAESKTEDLGQKHRDYLIQKIKKNV